MKQVSRLKNKHGWVIDKMTKKNHHLIEEKGHHEKSNNELSITYRIEMIENKKLSLIQCQVVHHHDGMYDCYHHQMIDDYQKRFEMLDQALFEINYEIESGYPYIKDHQLKDRKLFKNI